jgi:hypothetical protein
MRTPFQPTGEFAQINDGDGFDKVVPRYIIRTYAPSFNGPIDIGYAISEACRRGCDMEDIFNQPEDLVLRMLLKHLLWVLDRGAT